MSHARKRITRTTPTIAVVLVALALQAPGQSLGPGSLFGLTNVCDIHLKLEPGEWAKLQPPKHTDWNVFAAFQDVQNDAVAGRHFHSEKSTRPGLAGYLGIDHQYGQADITLNGETVRGIGLRYKGNGTFVEGRARGKFSFKVDFHEYIEDQEFRGLTKFNLHNNVTDPSMLREALSYELLREAGLPASRVGWARVKLTVPGQFDGKDLGLYSLVEQVDKRFLKYRFGSAKGLLLKPSTFGVFRYFGEDWSEYEKAYFPKTKPTAGQKKRLIDFARLVQKADAATFAREVDAYLDVDEFLRFLAVNVLICNLDSFLGGAQNYYAYLEPKSNKFQLWSWDMDHSFGAFGLVGTPKTRRDLSIDHPHAGENKLIERLLSIPRHKETYHEYLQKYLDTIFAEAKLHQQITETAGFLRPLIAATGKETLARFERIVADAPRENEPHPLKFFVTERRESVKNQLAGRSNGQRLQMKNIPNLRVIITVGVAVLFALLLNFGAYVWAVVAGFRGSGGWGVLNLVFYPILPLIYGFGVRRDLGRRSAIMTLASVGVLVLTVLASVWALA